VATKGCPHREKPIHADTAQTYRVTVGGAEFIVQAIPITLLTKAWSERWPRHADTLGG
jgi:hypothetical protein